MRFFCLLILLLAAIAPDSIASEFLEIDLNKKEIKCDSFSFGNYSIGADLSFDLRQKDGSLIFDLQGKDIVLAPKGLKEQNWLSEHDFSSIDMRISLRENYLSVSYIRLPEFLVRGKIDLATQDLIFDIDGNWHERSASLDGNTKLSLKIWGKPSDYLVSGTLNVENGTYRDTEFSKFFVHFLGKPPVFHFNDSQITLKDGSIYDIEGALDMRNFSNIFPKAAYISKKVTLGDWTLLSESGKNVGLKKNVDDKVDVVFDTYDRSDQSIASGTEVRYKIQKDQFLRLRMQDDKTIIGFEKRKDF